MKYSGKKTKKLLIATSAVSLGMIAGGFVALGGEKAAAETPKIPDGCEISVQDGTSLKLNEKGGLRFIFKMNSEMKKYIADNDTADNVKLIAHVGAATSVATQNVSCTIDEEKLYRISGDESWYANVCLVSVLEKNYSLEYTAQAFLEIGGTKVQASAINDKARGSFYDVATRALLDVTEDYAETILNLSSYSWLGTEAHPLYIDSLDLYNGLVAKINDGLDFSEKYVAIRSSVEVESGTALNEGKTLPANNYKLSRVTFKDGKNELGSVMVKNGEQATFASPADRTDGDDKLVFEKWVTENGGDAEADLSAISGDTVVYAKYRRVHANAITAFNTADLVYGATPAFTATAKYGEAAITYSKTKDGEYKAWAELENHDAGKYFAKASVAATSGYSAAEQIVEFNVNKAMGNAVTGFIMADRIHCNDTPAPLATATYGTVTYLYSKTADGEFVAWESVKYDGIGNYTYYVKAVVLETENYDTAESTVKSFRSEHEFVDGVCSLGGTPHTQSGIAYEVDGDVACIAGYNGNHSTEVYPVAEYEGKPVTYVKNGCAWNPNTTKIVLPASVTDFKGLAFMNAANLEYISMLGVKQISTNNNFLDCEKIKTVIVNKDFQLNDQQFKNRSGKGAASGIVYVNGVKAESTYTCTNYDANNQLSQHIYYKGDATKCGQWNFNDKGEIVHGAAEHNYKDGVCSICGEKDAMGVLYGYNAAKGVYYVAGYNGSGENVTVFSSWDDGKNGEKAVKYVEFGAFRGNTSIRSVILPESVNSLEGAAFLDCTNLEYVSMTGVETMNWGTIYNGKDGDNNFLNCTKLRCVVIGEKLSSNCQQFLAGSAPENPILSFYVKGESGAPQLTGNNNLYSGKVYYYSETEKSGCWHYENGVATLWA